MNENFILQLEKVFTISRRLSRAIFLLGHIPEKPDNPTGVLGCKYCLSKMEDEAIAILV